MEIKTKIFYEILKKDPGANRTDIVDFLEKKDYVAKVETLKDQLSTDNETVKNGTKVNFIRTRNGKSKTVMSQVLKDVDDIEDIKQEWAENRAYDAFLENCLDYLYEQEVVRAQV